MTTLASPRSITVSLATSGFLVVVAVAATRTSTTMPLLAVSALGVVAFVLRSHPGPAISATLGMMALPYAWSPHVPKMGVGFGIVASILLIAAFFADARALQVGAIDIVVVVISLTPPLIELAEAQPHISEWLSPSILLPYFAFRCILEHPKARAAFAPQ